MITEEDWKKVKEHCEELIKEAEITKISAEVMHYRAIKELTEFEVEKQVKDKINNEKNNSIRKGKT